MVYGEKAASPRAVQMDELTTNGEVDNPNERLTAALRIKPSDLDAGVSLMFF
jgi:hypothetical protein